MRTLKQETQVKLLEAMLDGSKVATIVTDPSKEDNPIIYTNNTFEKMTGYGKEETIGQNCRFLQGKDTSPEDVRKIRDGIENREDTTVTLLNYRKDGTPFWNLLSIKPVTVNDSQYFIGTQTDVSVEREQQMKIIANEQEIEKLMLPILSIQDNVATVALVGTMNHHRFEMLKVKVCVYVQEHRTEHVIIDITGLSWADTPPLHGFIQIRDALKIMGSNLYVTGISPLAAQEFIQKEDQENRLTTFSTIKKALKRIEG